MREDENETLDEEEKRRGQTLEAEETKEREGERENDTDNKNMKENLRSRCKKT